jgi:hypothetical protein
MNDFDARLDDARELYPDADEATLLRIAARAEALAVEAERAGIADGTPYSAAQSEYGCDWQWGDGTTLRDALGRIVPDEDAEPTARVFDCDGETIALVTDDE